MDALDVLMRARRPGGFRVAVGGIAIAAMALLGAGFLSEPPRPPETPSAESPRSEPARSGFIAAGLIDGNGGWAVTNEALVLSGDRGTTWRNISPPGVGVGAIRAALFLDRYHGWVASSAPLSERAEQGEAVIRIDSTGDGGQTWSASRVTARAAAASSIELVSLDFVNSQIGWLVVRLASAGTDRFGLLFATTDGGVTWRQATTPTAAPVEFTSADDGWTVDAGGAAIFVTHDGARTWRRVTTPLPPDRAGWHATYALPRFFGGTAGIVPVVAEESDAAAAPAESLFYRTADGGASWTLAARTGGKHKSWGEVATFRPISSAKRWMARSGSVVAMTVNAGDTWSGLSPMATLGRYNVVGLDFATDEFGWAMAVPVDDGCWLEGGFVCPGSVGRLARTVDGGTKWELLDPS